MILDESDRIMPSSFGELRDLLNQAFRGQIKIDSIAIPNGFGFKLVLIHATPQSATLLYLKILWVRFFDEIFGQGACLQRCPDVIPPNKIETYVHLDDHLKNANEVLARFLPLAEVYRTGGFTVSQALHSHEDADVVKAYHVVLAWLKLLQVWKCIEFEQQKRRGKCRLLIRHELPAVSNLLRKLAVKGGLNSEDIYERGRRLPGSGFLHH